MEKFVETCAGSKENSFYWQRKLKGFRFVGTAEVHEEGKYYEDAVEWAVGKMVNLRLLL